jgi:hypothetical protein
MLLRRIGEDDEIADFGSCIKNNRNISCSYNSVDTSLLKGLMIVKL